MANNTNRGFGQRASDISQRVICVVSSNLFLKLTFLWFIVQAIYFAFSVKFGIPPDEDYHLTFIRLFAQHSPSPFLSDSGIPGVLLEVARNPFFLYHYLLSFPYLIIRHLPQPYVWLRMINVLLGTGSLYLVNRIASQLKVSTLVRNLSIFMLANTLMFVFLSASINYDNLFIPLCLASVYLLLRLFDKVTARDSLMFLAVTLAGLMVKISFLPMAAVVLALLAAKHWRHLPAVLTSFKKTFRQSVRLNWLLIIVVLLLGGLFSQRYVYNLATYHSYQPVCPSVRAIGDCRQSALFARDESLSGPNRHPATASWPSYLQQWSKLMAQRVYGVFGHMRFPANKYIELWSVAAAALFALAFAVKWRPSDQAFTIVVVVSLFYLLSLIIDNHNLYNQTGRLQLAVQGRYVFGVLPLIYLAGNHYAERLLKDSPAMLVYLVVTLAIFSISGLPTYLRKATPEWHANLHLGLVAPVQEASSQQLSYDSWISQTMTNQGK